MFLMMNILVCSYWCTLFNEYTSIEESYLFLQSVAVGWHCMGSNTPQPNGLSGTKNRLFVFLGKNWRALMQFSALSIQHPNQVLIYWTTDVYIVSVFFQLIWLSLLQSISFINPIFTEIVPRHVICKVQIKIQEFHLLLTNKKES